MRGLIQVDQRIQRAKFAVWAGFSQHGQYFAVAAYYNIFQPCCAPLWFDAPGHYSLTGFLNDFMMTSSSCS
jgi:hypothetical protein